MIAAVIAVAFVIVSDNEAVITVLDNKDEVIVADSVSNYSNSENAAYLDVVVNEAINALADKYSLTTETAQKKLLNNDYTIYTNFDVQISSTLKDVCGKYSDKINIGGAITNLDGDLLSVISASRNSENSINYCLQKNSPCSAFKPLAVYAPAIEKKIINWSTLFDDSPYSKIKGSDGVTKDWPQNASGTYSNTDVTVSKAISKSLNTVAVKCLSKYGVNNSIKFLEKNFGINLDYEKKQSSMKGEDEVIGNIALGSMYQGLSTVDMAGYYQIFANGGIYSSPKTIRMIVDANGETIYESSKERKQVISDETSQIVNELLQNVVTDPEGTGKKAFCKNVPVAGKTGTGDNDVDNWFVGVTSEYSCAIWHSSGAKNTCPEIFSEVLKNVEHKKLLFPTSKNVAEKIYCLESGKLASKNCKTFDVGCYTYGTQIPYCDYHK